MCILKIVCKFTLKRVVVWRTPVVQHISRIECMASCGAPRSRTAIPKRAAKIGPIVVPHGLSFLTITSCVIKEILLDETITSDAVSNINVHSTPREDSSFLSALIYDVLVTEARLFFTFTTSFFLCWTLLFINPTWSCEQLVARSSVHAFRWYVDRSHSLDIHKHQ